MKINIVKQNTIVLIVILHVIFTESTLVPVWRALSNDSFSCELTYKSVLARKKKKNKTCFKVGENILRESF